MTSTRTQSCAKARVDPRFLSFGRKTKEKLQRFMEKCNCKSKSVIQGKPEMAQFSNEPENQCLV